MILTRTVEALLACDRIDRLVCVICPQMRDLYDLAVAGIDRTRLLAPVPGGADRAGSVLERRWRRLEPLAPGRVLIHDAARPFVPAALLDRASQAGRRRHFG